MPNRSGNKNRGPMHNRYKHGMTGTPTYKSWSGMKRRCYVENSTDYKNYGARGIVVCDRWHKFENFLADMGEAPTGMSIERINNDGNYEPSNCRWANKTDQSRNRRYVKLDHETALAIINDRKSGKTWQWLADRYGISSSHARRVALKESWR